MIVTFKNQPVSEIDELHRHLVATAIGIPAQTTIIRHTEKIQLTITPEELITANQKN
ncbi:MAG: hypothetical protein WDM76_06995 [Limisphaerales bacterium]